MESTCAAATTTTSPTAGPTFPTGRGASSAGHADPTADEFDAAFTALMPRLRHRLIALTGNPHDADDLLQETYLRLSRRARARTLARQQQPYAYACATALNLLRDHWRRPRAGSAAPTGCPSRAGTAASHARRPRRWRPRC